MKQSLLCHCLRDLSTLIIHEGFDEATQYYAIYHHLHLNRICGVIRRYSEVKRTTKARECKVTLPDVLIVTLWS